MPLLVAMLLSSPGFGTPGFGTNDCLAQVRRYQPHRPTTSPYLQLTRRNTGALPNYHALVRPAQRQQAINQREQASRKQHAGAIQRLQNSVQLGLHPASATGKRSGFQVPSSRSGFGTSGRYFRTNNALGRR